MYTTFSLMQEVMRKTHQSLRNNLVPYGLYKGQPRVFGFVCHHDGISKKEIATRFNISMATVSKTIERLEKNDFVSTKLDENDKRKRRVYITERGIKADHELIGFKKSYAEMIFKDISEEDIVVFEKVLEQMKKNAMENAYETDD